jgi:hypothetical protein
VIIFYRLFLIDTYYVLLGFFHEHSRPDRDEYVQILYDNIKADMVSEVESSSEHWCFCSFQKHNFKKNAWGTSAVNQNTKYDYASILHYATSFFSTNGKPTLLPRQSNITIGKAQNLSPTDIKEVRQLYGC